MIRIISKWAIKIYFNNPEETILLYIYDDFYLNMLSKLREISFNQDPIKIVIDLVENQRQTGVFQK
jgi:hypothetical protein